jgi:hypothetical protein
VDNRSVRAGGPFAYAGDSGTQRDEDTPHGCVNGWLYIGHVEVDEESGCEVEVIYRVVCRRCDSSAIAGEGA